MGEEQVTSGLPPFSKNIGSHRERRSLGRRSSRCHMSCVSYGDRLCFSSSCVKLIRTICTSLLLYVCVGVLRLAVLVLLLGLRDAFAVLTHATSCRGCRDRRCDFTPFLATACPSRSNTTLFGPHPICPLWGTDLPCSTLYRTHLHNKPLENRPHRQH